MKAAGHFPGHCPLNGVETHMAQMPPHTLRGED
jgi:hypothetical protein